MVPTLNYQLCNVVAENNQAQFVTEGGVMRGSLPMNNNRETKMHFTSGHKYVVCTWICTIMTVCCCIGLVFLLFNPNGLTTAETAVEHLDNTLGTTGNAAGTTGSTTTPASTDDTATTTDADATDTADTTAATDDTTTTEASMFLQ